MDIKELIFDLNQVCLRIQALNYGQALDLLQLIMMKIEKTNESNND